MTRKWLSIPEVAQALRLSQDETRKLARRERWPVAFRAYGEVVLASVPA